MSSLIGTTDQLSASETLLFNYSTDLMTDVLQKKSDPLYNPMQFVYRKVSADDTQFYILNMICTRGNSCELCPHQQ